MEGFKEKTTKRRGGEMSNEYFKILRQEIEEIRIKRRKLLNEQRRLRIELGELKKKVEDD